MIKKRLLHLIMIIWRATHNIMLNLAHQIDNKSYQWAVHNQEVLTLLLLLATPLTIKSQFNCSLSSAIVQVIMGQVLRNELKNSVDPTCLLYLDLGVSQQESTLQTMHR